MARASFVDTGDDDIHDTKPGEWTHTLRCHPLSRPDRAVRTSGMLQGPHDCCANGNHPSAAPAPFDQHGR
jgi:hypothetical protein